MAISRAGAASWRGALYFFSASPHFAQLNSIAVLFEFEIGDYFRDLGVPLPHPAFLETVVIDFSITDRGGHYHVPLLVSPFGYSTYRGS